MTRAEGVRTPIPDLVEVAPDIRDQFLIEPQLFVPEGITLPDYSTILNLNLLPGVRVSLHQSNVAELVYLCSQLLGIPEISRIHMCNVWNIHDCGQDGEDMQRILAKPYTYGEHNPNALPATFITEPGISPEELDLLTTHTRRGANHAQELRLDPYYSAAVDSHHLLSRKHTKNNTRSKEDAFSMYGGFLFETIEVGQIWDTYEAIRFDHNTRPGRGHAEAEGIVLELMEIGRLNEKYKDVFLQIGRKYKK